MITLYYIEGISENDEPVFTALALQENFFNKHIIRAIDSGFYPPHFRNKIKLDIDDFDLTTNVNYLSLDFNNKVYYYFIDNIAYISESIYELEVSMDVVQTYMFNIDAHRVRYERLTIPRWVNNEELNFEINRDYIRENMGEDIFDSKGDDYNYYSGKMAVIISKPEDKVSNFPNQTSISNGVMSVTNASTLIILPDYDSVMATIRENVSETNLPTYKQLFIASNDWEYRIVTKGGTSLISHGTMSDIPNIFYNEITDPTTRTAIHVPIELLGITYKYYTEGSLDIIEMTLPDTCTYNVKDKEVYINPEGQLAVSTDEKINNSNFPIKEYDIVNISFNKNNQLKRSFSWLNCPQMLDVNFMRLTFGDNSIQATYPLEHAKSTNLYGYVTIDLFTGNMMYYLTDTKLALDKKDAYLSHRWNISNVYDTLVISSIDISNSLLTDPYRQYDMQNKGRLLGAIGGLVTPFLGGVTYSLGESAVRGSNDSSGTQDIKTRTTAFTGYKGIKHRTMMSTITQRSSMSSNSISEVLNKGINPMGIIAGGVGNTIDFAQKELNYSLSPNVYKVSTSITSSMQFATLQLHEKAYVKRGIEEYARYFESCGYRVEKTIFEDDLFNNEYYSRYYYNAVKCSDMDIDLKNIPTDEATINLIKGRFYDGIRLWRTDNTGNLYGKMGQPTLYDNVERSFIND